MSCNRMSDSQEMKASNETNRSRASSAIASSSSNMDHLSLGQLMQSLLRGDEDDHDMCQDIKKTVEEYMVLNRAQLSVSERLLAVNEQLLASQLHLLEADNNDAAASTADHYLMDTTARDSSAASKKNKAAAKKRRNKRNKATAKRKKTKHVPGLNGGIIPQILMVIFGSFMMLFLMSLIHKSDGSEGASPPSLPPTPSLRRNIRQPRQFGISSSPPTLPMVQSPFFSTSSSSSSSPNLSTDVSTTSINACVDTPNWEDYEGDDCRYYEKHYPPGCHEWGHLCDGGMGVARDNCCHCKKDLSCEELKMSCQKSLEEGYALEVCYEAESSCCGATDEATVLTKSNGDLTTVGLYNKCKCDFWTRMCDHGNRDAAFFTFDHAAEYCCGDYKYTASEGTFQYLNSPVCYCDFSKYIDSVSEEEYRLKPKTINVTKFTDACGQVFNEWWSGTQEDEKMSLEAMYTRLGGDNWTRKDGWMIDTAHCQWFGISCEEGYVTRVDLGGNNLKGQFPVYTRNDTNESNNWRKSKFGLANLYKLVHLDLANNNLTGTIEYAPLYNLEDLKEFNISGNNLYGEADALVAPKLEKADFGYNSFTSMHRFEKYKWTTRDNHLWWCDASNNAIQQDAADLLKHIPPYIEHFIAVRNQINGSLPESLNELRYLREFKLASNYLSGTLPSFEESHTTLQELDISLNGLTGEIPEDLWRSDSFKTLNLAGNRLTGTIPSLIGDLAVLKVFDVSNNRLTGPIPSEVDLLAGSLKLFNLTNNTFTGSIPAQVGLLQGASVLLKGNLFNNASRSAPLSLCALRNVKEFDLKDHPKLCPPERNALNDFFDKAKGGDWLDGSMWLDEYESYCSWKGVTCDEMDHVMKLRLPTNGLSGILSESIANLTSLEELDLSNNDMKGPIPAELGLLSNLTYLRLSYNVFTGTAPAGLGEMKRLQLLQLQSNRITGMPVVPRINDSIHGESTFVTDCGVPSDFDEALDCKNCTMCCNANDDCYPQDDTKVTKSGFKHYGAFSGILAAFFFFFCCIVTLILNVIDKRRHSDADLRRSSMARRTRLNDDKYALSAIGKDSVYKYFVGDNVFGWLAALTTIGTQIWILTVFVKASELNLQDEKIDIEFTWKCPRDTDTCDNKADLDGTGWAIFAVLMTAYLAKDLISGAKLIAHSAKRRHDHKSRLRYFFGGICLGWITVFILYVSTLYNKALATSNTGIIVNSVVILFIMEIDEKIFATLAAINEKWTAHAAESDDLATAESSSKNNADERDNMKDELAAQKEQIAAQRDEIAIQKEQMATQREEIAIQREQMETQRNEMAMLRAAVKKIMQEAYGSDTPFSLTRGEF